MSSFGARVDQLRICTEKQGEVFVFRLTGEADLPSVPDLLNVVRPVLEQGRRIVVDISELEFCSFSVLSALDRWRIAAAVYGGKLHVSGLSSRLRSVLMRIGMAELLVPESAGDGGGRIEHFGFQGLSLR
jgi:anti-anti-sigma factor